MIKVFYGLTNHSQLKRLPRHLDIMLSARWLLQVSPRSIAFDYMTEYAAVFLDSGAFGAALFDGGFTYSLDDYLELVSRVKPEHWASMDYPCEPSIRNGQTISQRIDMTVSNARELKGSNLPGFIPVIQGWDADDYLECIDKYDQAGLIQPVMAIGSICRRGSQASIVNVVRHLAARLPGVEFHAFGVKITALTYNNGELLNYLHSIDTAAWQFNEKDDQGGCRLFHHRH